VFAETSPEVISSGITCPDSKKEEKYPCLAIVLPTPEKNQIAKKKTYIKDPKKNNGYLLDGVSHITTGKRSQDQQEKEGENDGTKNKCKILVIKPSQYKRAHQKTGKLLQAGIFTLQKRVKFILPHQSNNKYG